jgi:hypothetical protein
MREENVKTIKGLMQECKTALENGDHDTAGPFLMRAMRLGLHFHPLKSLQEELKIFKSAIVNLNENISFLNKRKVEFEERIQHLKADLRYQDIRDEYDKIKEKFDYPKWYTLKTGTGKSAITTLRKLAVKLGLEKQYDGSYGVFSQEIHGNNATNKIVLIDDKAVLKNIEEPTLNLEAHDAFGAGLYTLSQVIQDFLIFYGKKDESEELREKMGSLPVK